MITSRLPKGSFFDWQISHAYFCFVSAFCFTCKHAETKLKQYSFTETKHCFAFVLFQFCFSFISVITTVFIPVSASLILHPSSQRNHELDVTPVPVQMHPGVHNDIETFFFPRTIPQWNDLDKETAEATTINCFNVACTSPPSPFVDAIPHIGSLSTTFQI